MNTTQLDKKLDDVLNIFVKEIDIRFPKGDTTVATYDDLYHLAQQFIYAMDSFRKEINKNIK